MILLAIIGGLFAFKGAKNHNKKLVWMGIALVALPILPAVVGGIIGGGIVYGGYWAGTKAAAPATPQLDVAKVAG